jgi:hypothetical protein
MNPDFPGVPLIIPVFHWVNNDNTSSAGYKLFSYFAGTSNPKATFADSSLLTPNANPVVLDAAGNANVFLDNGLYKFVLTTQTGVVLWTADNISQDAFNGLITNGTALTVALGKNGNIVTGTTYTLGATTSVWNTATVGGDIFGEYNSSTGTFTAAQPGMYYVSALATYLNNGFSPAVTGSLQIYINGNPVFPTSQSMFMWTGTNFRSSAQVSALMGLLAQDQVSVKTLTPIAITSGGPPSSEGGNISIFRVR